MKSILISLFLSLISIQAAIADFPAPNLNLTPSEVFLRNDKGEFYRRGLYGDYNRPYLIFQDYGFIYPYWTGKCSKDAMDDSISCVIVNDQTDMAFIFRSPGIVPDFICVANHRYPGKTALIRVEDQKPLVTNERGCITDVLAIMGIIKASRFATRKYVFPNDVPVDKMSEMSFFEDAKSIMVHLRKNLGLLDFPVLKP